MCSEKPIVFIKSSPQKSLMFILQKGASAVKQIKSFAKCLDLRRPDCLVGAWKIAKTNFRLFNFGVPCPIFMKFWNFSSFGIERLMPVLCKCKNRNKLRQSGIVLWRGEHVRGRSVIPVAPLPSSDPYEKWCWLTLWPFSCEPTHIWTPENHFIKINVILSFA